MSPALILACGGVATIAVCAVMLTAVYIYRLGRRDATPPSTSPAKVLDDIQPNPPGLPMRMQDAQTQVIPRVPPGAGGRMR